MLAAWVAFVVAAWAAHSFPSGDDPALGGLVAGIIVFILSMNEVKRGQSGIDLKLANFYAVAEEEYDGGMVDKGLWSQAIVEAKGDESLRKVEYMKLRVMQLKRES